MSGLKETTITYDPRGELIIKIRATINNSLSRVKFIETQIEGFSNRIIKVKASVKNSGFTEYLMKLSDDLDLNIKDLNKRKNMLEKYVVNIGATESGLKKYDNEISKEQQSIQDISNSADKLNRQVLDIAEADNIIPELSTGLNTIESSMKDKGSLLHEWAPKDYEDLVVNTGYLKQQFDKYMTDIGSGKLDTSEISSINNIDRSLRAYAGKIESLITDSTIKDTDLKKLKKRLDQLKQDLNEQIISSRDSVVKDILNNYSVNLKPVEIELAKKKYEGADIRLSSIANNLPLLKHIDEMSSNIEVQMNKIEEIFKEHNDILGFWTLQDFESSSKEKTNILEELNKYKEKMQKGTVIDIPGLSLLFERTTKLSEKVNSTLSYATEKDKLDQKRVYVLKCLRQVCNNLGFKEMGTPHLKQASDPVSPVVQQFDTLDRGTITFNITLEGKLESSSGISVIHCDEEFSKLSKLLKEKYGIGTSFRRIDGGGPIKKYKTAKDLPTSAGKLSQGK